MSQETISNFLNTKYLSYAEYVISNRAIPSIKDGLKPVQRRIFWIARDSAKEYVKVANLAGQCLKIHPHGDVPISQAISNLAQDFSGANNIPLFLGKGAFGCKILGPGKGIGASRYVSVKLSKFTKDNLFVDEDLITEVPNYDGEFTECENFLPLIPFALLNGISGIAVGFATEILPYNLSDIISMQIEYIKTGKILPKILVTPYYKGFKGQIVWNQTESRFYTVGCWKQEKNVLYIAELPIGVHREGFIKILDTLLEKGVIKDYYDNSKDEYNFKIILSRGAEFSDKEIVAKFKLQSWLNENLTLLDTNGKLKVYNSIKEIVEEFTDWRFSFIKKRYEKKYSDLKEKTEELEELKRFIEFVIEKNYIIKMTKMKRAQIKEDLQKKFPRIEEMLNRPVSIFTQDNIKKIEEQIKMNLDNLSGYDKIIKDEKKQKDIFIEDLKGLLKNAS